MGGRGELRSSSTSSFWSRTFKFPKNARRGQKPPIGAKSQTIILPPEPPLYLYFNHCLSLYLLSNDIIPTTDLLNTAAERLAYVNRLWDLVEVPVTSDEKIKGQGQLRERAAGHAFNERLIVHFEETVSTSAREPDDVPLVYWNPLSAPATTCQTVIIIISVIVTEVLIISTE